MFALAVIFVIAIFAAVVGVVVWNNHKCATSTVVSGGVDQTKPDASFKSPPRYFEMVSGDTEESPETKPDSALEREGTFYVDGTVIPKMGEEDVDPDVDESSETIRAYDDTADGMLAEYQDARLQRNRELQSKSHSPERYEMTKKMVSREIETGVEEGPWWDEPN